MVDAIRKRYLDWRKRRAIGRLRGHLAFFGHDVSDMTDEEIEKAVIRMSATIGEAVRKASVSAEEFSAAMLALGKAARRMKDSRV